MVPLQLRSILVLHVSPFLDIMEVHDTVRPSKAPQSVPPLSVNSNVWTPPRKLVNFLWDFVFNGVNNEVAD